VTLDMVLGVEDMLISWFVIILALLGAASLFVCCMIHCKHLRLSDANKLSYLLTYLLTYYKIGDRPANFIKILSNLPQFLHRWKEN